VLAICSPTKSDTFRVHRAQAVEVPASGLSADLLRPLAEYERVIGDGS
jgi:hypothetical protein